MLINGGMFDKIDVSTFGVLKALRKGLKIIMDDMSRVAFVVSPSHGISPLCYIEGTQGIQSEDEFSVLRNSCAAPFDLF